MVGRKEIASCGTFAEYLYFGEITVMATSWSGVSNAIRQAIQ